MAKKEAKTDLWVARQLDDSKIKYDAQGSDVKEINDALQSASKRGTGNAGYPEYVAVVKDFVIVIEDKADLAKHQKLTDTGILSTDQKDIADYAVNGAYFYAKHIAQNSSFHKIFAIGVSGDEKHHKITPLYVDDREGCAILVREEFSCLEFIMNRDTINWILKKLNTGGRTWSIYQRKSTTTASATR